MKDKQIEYLIKDKDSRSTKRIVNTGKKKLFLEFVSCKFLAEEEMTELRITQVDHLMP